MVFSKSATKPTRSITMKGEPLEQVDQYWVLFMYLGSMVMTDAKSGQEIKRRISVAKTAYKKMARVLESRSVTIATRLLNCYVWSTLLYCCEGWTISKTMEALLQTAEMWFLLSVNKIKYFKGSMKATDSLCQKQCQKWCWNCLSRMSKGRVYIVVQQGADNAL